jgi:predicted ATPase
MSIDAVRLRNFRGFKDAQIQLKPLTVLLGPNSSGKSSFGHALSAMAHAHWAAIGSGQATLSPRGRNSEDWPVDLGEYKDLRTDGVHDRVYIDLLTETGWVSFGFGKIRELPDLRLSYIRHPAATESASSGRGGGKLVSLDPTIGSKAGRSLGIEVSFETNAIELIRQNEVFWKDTHGYETQVALDGLVLNTAFHAGGTAFTLSHPSRQSLRDFLDTLRYLRGVRERPLRAYRTGEASRQQMGYSGEFATSVYYSNRKKVVQYSAPIAVEKSVARKAAKGHWTRRKEPLETALGRWLHHLGIGESADPRKSRRHPGELTLRLGLQSAVPQRDITEVGFGVSQVFPLLVQGLLLEPNALFVVDLPEAHLHPNPQAALADFFCSIALSGRRCLVETHSEMFFHQLRLRAATNSELAEKIAVYFIDRPDSNGLCNPPNRVGLSLEDEVQWPVGFLDQAWKLETLIKQAREARTEE